MFADGTQFRGEWEEDAWLQSAADPALSKVVGLTDGLAGQHTSFTIQVQSLQLFGLQQMQEGCISNFVRGSTSHAFNTKAETTNMAVQSGKDPVFNATVGLLIATGLNSQGCHVRYLG